MTGLVMLHATLGLVAVAARVQLFDDFVSASGGAAAGAIARWRFNAAGTVQTKQGTAAYVTPYNWLLIGANTEFEAQITQVSSTGGTLTGTSASWIAMTADKEITYTTGIVGSVNQATIQVKIRDKTTLVELATCLIDMESEWV